MCVWEVLYLNQVLSDSICLFRPFGLCPRLQQPRQLQLRYVQLHLRGRVDRQKLLRASLPKWLLRSRGVCWRGVRVRPWLWRWQLFGAALPFGLLGPRIVHRWGVRLWGVVHRRRLHGRKVSQRLLGPGAVHKRDVPVPTWVCGWGLLARLLCKQLQQEGNLQGGLLRLSGWICWRWLQLW